MTVILVTYNSAKVVASALRVFSGLSDVEVIAVDNASSDASVEVVRAALPAAKVIVSQTNLGFAGAVNLGAQHASGDAILLLNPDAVLEANAVDRLLEGLRAQPGLGIVAPLMLDPGGAHPTVAAGRAPTIWRMFTHGTGLSRFSARAPWLEGHYLLSRQIGDSGRIVDWVSGGCMLIQRRLWDELEGLSTRWFMYAEDIEFCLRAGKAGWQVAIIPEAHATHVGGGSSAGIDGSVKATWVVNLFDLYATQIASTRAQREAWRAVVNCGFLMRSAVFALVSSVQRSDDRRVRYSHQARRFIAFARGLARVDVGAYSRR